MILEPVQWEYGQMVLEEVVAVLDLVCKFSQGTSQVGGSGGGGGAGGCGGEYGERGSLVVHHWDFT